MELIFFLKPIADMLYQLQWIDVLLTFLCLFQFVFSTTKIRLNRLDFIIIAISFLYVLSFIRNIEGFATWVKIESCFLLYFIGRKVSANCDKYPKEILKGFSFVMFFTVFSDVVGFGYQMWGSVNTFSGLYYFKTDLAAGMAQCFLFITIMPMKSFNKTKKLIIGLITILCVYYILLSNARIYYFILSLLCFYAFLYHREIRGKERFRVGMKFIFAILFLVIAVIAVMNFLSKGVIGDNYLLISYDDPSDLLNESNTQGRSVVWALILRYFFDQGLISHLFGIDLITDGIVGEICESHNLYLKILFTIGFVGAFLFAFLILMSFKMLKKIKDVRLYYITLGLITIFLISGISYSSIISTQLSWFPMFYLGICVSKCNCR